MQLKLRRLSAAAAGLVVALSVSTAAFAADETRVRVLHASPDAPAVDIYLDNQMVDALTNVPFGTLSGYLAVPAGAHNVKVYATGTSTSPVIDANVTLATGKSYTIAATNAVASIEAQVIVDNPAPKTGRAQVRVVHLSADAPAVDVAVDGAAPADALVKGLAYPDASAYLNIPAGSYDLEVRVAGTSTVALQLDPVTVADGQSYSVFAIGSAAAGAANGLQIAVGVDGTALPDTSTELAPAASVTPALMVLAGLALLLVSVRLAVRGRKV